MCGIAGIAVSANSRPPSLEQLRAMCVTLRHRGPDDEGAGIRERVGLCATRLAIIDLEGGHQPYVSEDGQVRAVFNGEIYNYRELRTELRRCGHKFSTATDGEVIVHLWEDRGADFLSHLNGMFALALHDSARGQLLLARDRMGIKPLYYSLGPQSLSFGSEIKALLAAGGVELALDVDSLGQFLSWEYVPAPGTLLKGVKKLEPGALLEMDLRAFSVRVRRWWDIPTPDREGGVAWPRSDEEWEDAVDAKVGEAVRRQLVADVPLGTFLSGGVDSSLVASNAGGSRAYSISFADPSYSEIEWSDRVARHLGVEHRVDMIRPNALDLFDDLMHFMDDPIGDFSIFPTYLVSRHARNEVTVALSGDGGDELFGGYETYLAQDRARQWSKLPRPIRRHALEPVIRGLRPRPEKRGLVNKLIRFAEGLQFDEALGHARWRLFVGERFRADLFTPEAYREMVTGVPDHIHMLLDEAGTRSELDRALYVDARSYLSDNCLVKVDRMSMACSLEVRVPLLDHELMELAFRMPSHLKLSGGRTKPLLKRVAARHVPRECVYRPKQGFSIPMKHWLGSELRHLLEELLDERRVSEEGIFRAGTVARLKTEHLSGARNHSHILWPLLVFQDWRRRWGA